jgi:hypothetical protein
MAQWNKEGDKEKKEVVVKRVVKKKKGIGSEGKERKEEMRERIQNSVIFCFVERW